MDQLVALDIDEQLRLMALKEMCIVEIKDNISNLTLKLDSHEKELHKLREVIQKSLYRELKGNTSGVKTRHQRQNSNPRDEAIASTRNKSRRRTLSSSLHYQQAKDVSAAATTPSTTSQGGADKRNSKLWTNLAKPLNMLQQFDSMLQSEFEKSLVSTPHLQSQHPQHLSVDQSSGSTHYRSRNSEDSISSYGSVPSPLKSKSKPVSSIDLDKDFPEPASSSETLTATSLKPPQRNTEDMLQTVSSSIWSFVNDVKTNVLSSLSEEDSKGAAVSRSSSGAQLNHSPMYNLDTGSTIHLNEEDDSNGNTLVFQDDKAIINNSDYEDLLDTKDDELDDKIDLSMYSSIRKNS
ncbi:uncharacterized protein CANTADRAFT_50784 [Suhomyces tanzawaensis NRRL Y-17324]|uniref:Topoisomerase I damage affected protein 11 n=1 Tax=Suhomyces tanzawaensis NRRL Y-17324 TaxID=984487 RepID=A0A1E4SHK9_9ASCO|nr:uncharacterized protein CANTADRAFT_50784 [Suhomyces tanzawaensis NRRL Y-17324]ODV78983.1 hypothetical protein CANTADRAFT_50784 [Suhomyces tanzawaensis NRRL Y-17324]